MSDTSAAKPLVWPWALLLIGAGAAAYGWHLNRPVPQVAAPPAAQVAAVKTPAPQEAPAQTAPVLDELRLEPGGLAVVAGRAEPGAELVLRVDGQEIGTTKADLGGSFATVAMLGASDDPRVLTLSELGASGAEKLALNEMILAPVAALPDVAPQVSTQMAVLGAPAAPEPASLKIATDSPVVGPADLPGVTAPDAETVALADTATPMPPAVAAPESKQVVVLKSGAEGVELVAPSQAPQVQTVALDTISYDDVGAVELTGRAQSQAEEVRVYLNNRPVTAITVNPGGGWRGALPEVDTGIYTLRVDEVNAAGTVTSRVETPFKRENPAVLAAATVDAPVQAITVQKGATLWAIARDRYGEGPLYVRVVEANRDLIRNPDLIYPGQVFSLPD